MLGVCVCVCGQMQHLFYHNHNDPDDSFTGTLNVKDIHRAITLHPVKRPAFNYRLHNFFRTRKSADLAHRLLLLGRDVRTMSELMKVGGQTGTLGRGQGQKSTGASSNDSTSLLPSVVKYVPAKVADVLPWEFLSSKAAFSHATTNPTRAVESGVRHAVDEVILQVMNTINKNARRRGRSIDFKEVLYGYRRVDPLHGADYILDLLLVYRKHKGRRMTIPVRRHAYIQQPFTALEFRELDPTLVGRQVTSATIGVGGSGTGVSSPASLLGYFQEKLASSLAMLNSAAAVSDGGQQSNGAVTAGATVSRLHFLVPLAGRHERLVDFMKNFESVCLIPEKVVSLYVLLFDSDDAQKSIALLNKYQQAYPQHVVRIEQIAGPFSRGGGLAQGCSLLDASALVVFMDIDIHMTREAIYRLRMNAIQSKQVYYPIVFSGYDSQVYCSSQAAESSCNSTRQAPFNDHTGYWRQSGYGIVSMYNSDFAAIGGFDANIQGWGKEDVELFERLLAAANVTLFRAVDPGLTHVFHAVNCDANLESVQYKMCLGTKAASYASLATLSRIVYAESWYKATDVASKVVRPPKLRGKA
jgi:chondroitin sulfate synthase